MNDTLKKIHKVITEFLAEHDCGYILREDPNSFAICLSFGKVSDAYVSDDSLKGKELYNASIRLSESIRAKYTDYNWITWQTYSDISWDDAAKRLSKRLKKELKTKIDFINDSANKEASKYNRVLNKL